MAPNLPGSSSPYLDLARLIRLNAERSQALLEIAQETNTLVNDKFNFHRDEFVNIKATLRDLLVLLGIDSTEVNSIINNILMYRREDEPVAPI